MSYESSSFEPRIVHVEPGPEFKARYDVLEELGKGRFGVVHKVVDRRSAQKLAAKFIKCRTAKDRDKVQEEIDIMNLLRHQKLLQLAAAFENPRDMIMVMEYISGGELFERVVADDFTLTEKDCILFMRQICEGVAYMHSQNVVHLDLKPENIMCHTRTSHEIKIIDFGLAQKLTPDSPIRVLFGTPEFIPPEIIGFEPIGIESDMWSIGVICYVLLSGLSPFMGDNDSETFANITAADYDFEDEAFNTVSRNAMDFIEALLIKRKENRLSAEQCLKHSWLDPDTHQETVVLCTDKLKKFIIRRKWQKTGNAIRALSRMANLSTSRRNSANSTPNTPRPSISGSSVPRMSSLNEEDKSFNEEKITNGLNLSIKSSVDEEDTPVDDRSNIDNNSCNISVVEPVEEIVTKSNGLNHPTKDIREEVLKANVNSDKINQSRNEDTKITPLKAIKDFKNESNKIVRTRACSERSDSGISDCSSHLTSSSCTSTPLLGKKFCIDEETEFSDEQRFNSSTTLILNNRNVDKNSERGTKNGVCRMGTERRSDAEDKKQIAALSLKFSNKIENFNNSQPVKCKSPSASSSLKRLPIYTSRTVAGTIKKFDPSHDTLDNSNLTNDHHKDLSLDNQQDFEHKTPSKAYAHVSKVEIMVEKLATPDQPHGIRYRCPSPSLLRKTQAVIAKERSTDYYMAKHGLKSPTPSPLLTPKMNKCPKSPALTRRDKPKSESFQKASAFWNSPKT